MPRFRRLLGLALVMGLLPALTHAADVAALIQTVQQVGTEGQGNVRAAAAVKELSGEGPDVLIPLLTALDGAEPLAANWLRGAIEVVADRALEANTMPAAALEAFVGETKHSPQARRYAYELLVKTDPTAEERLIPGMLSDSSVELRRDAVARLITQGDGLLGDKKNEEALKIYQQAMSGARDRDQIDALVKKLKELGVEVDLPKHFGFLMSWHLVGPFDNTDKAGFDVVYEPEKQVNLTSEIVGKGGSKIRWIRYTTKSETGIVDLAKALEAYKGAITYAVTDFDSDKNQDVELRLGTPNAWKVWVNGTLIFARDEYHRGTKLDQYRMKAHLNLGKNQILLKVCQNEQTESWAQDWKFQLRVCDVAGTAVLPKSTDSAARIETNTRAIAEGR